MVWAGDAASVTPRKCKGMEMNLAGEGSYGIVSDELILSLAQFSVVFGPDLLQTGPELQLLVPTIETHACTHVKPH